MALVAPDRLLEYVSNHVSENSGKNTFCQRFGPGCHLLAPIQTPNLLLALSRQCCSVPYPLLVPSYPSQQPPAWAGQA